MRERIRGFTLSLLVLAMMARAQTPLIPGNPSQATSITSGTPIYFTNSEGSGTVTLSYVFSGTPSSVSIVVAGCSPDGSTCTTLTPVSGSSTATPYVTTASGVQQFLSGYPILKVTPTFAGATLFIYKLGIQAKLSSPGGSSTTTLAGDATGPSNSNTVSAVHASDGNCFSPSIGFAATGIGFYRNTGDGSFRFCSGGNGIFILAPFNVFALSSNTPLGYSNGDPQSNASDVFLSRLGSKYFGIGDKGVGNGSLGIGSLLVTESATVTVTSSTITPTTNLFHLSGTGFTVSTMTPLPGMTTTVGPGGVGGCVDFIADSATVIAAGTGVGSFAASATLSVKSLYRACYTPSTGLWTLK
jgi:hypothetical protein